MPTIRQIAMARNNFKHMSAKRPDVFLSVYELLPTAAPGSEMLYSGSIRDRIFMLDGLISMALLSLDHPSALYGSLHRLGQQYADYGSWPNTYPILVELIVDSFAEANGTNWSAELAEAWRNILELIALGMLEGAQSQNVA